MTSDVSLNTLIISGVVALVGYGLKGVGGALIEAIKKLITHLIQTTAEVQMLKAQLSELIAAVGDIQKLRGDLTKGFERIKALEEKYKNLNGQI